MVIEETMWDVTQQNVVEYKDKIFTFTYKTETKEDWIPVSTFKDYIDDRVYYNGKDRWVKEFYLDDDDDSIVDVTIEVKQKESSQEQEDSNIPCSNDCYSQVTRKIKEYLEYCNENLTPYICKRKDDSEFVDSLINNVVTLIAKQGMTIKDAILYFESAMSDNMTHD